MVFLERLAAIVPPRRTDSELITFRVPEPSAGLPGGSTNAPPFSNSPSRDGPWAPRAPGGSASAHAAPRPHWATVPARGRDLLPV